MSGTIPIESQPDRGPLLRQVTRFLVIGGTAVAIDLTVYLVLAGLVNRHLAKGISYVAGMVFGFWGNKLWTFESRRQSLTEPAWYIGLYAVTLGCNVLLNWIVLVTCGPSYGLLAFLLATGTTTVLNFLGMKYLAFNR